MNKPLGNRILESLRQTLSVIVVAVVVFKFEMNGDLLMNAAKAVSLILILNFIINDLAKK